MGIFEILESQMTGKVFAILQKSCFCESFVASDEYQASYGNKHLMNSKKAPKSRGPCIWLKINTILAAGHGAYFPQTAVAVQITPISTWSTLEVNNAVVKFQTPQDCEPVRS